MINGPLATNAPLLYLVTDRHALDARLAAGARIEALLELLTEAARAGVDLIQLREKELSGREFYQLTAATVAAVRPLGTKVLVNDRVDVALAAGADGVHLATSSLPVAVARQLVGDQFLIGASTHSLAEVHVAAAAGADFVVFGPVFATPAKLKYGAPVGLAALRAVTAAAPIPVLAIGGITATNYSSVLAQGARGIAAISLFTQAERLAALVAQLKSGRTQ